MTHVTRTLTAKNRDRHRKRVREGEGKRRGSERRRKASPLKYFRLEPLMAQLLLWMAESQESK